MEVQSYTLQIPVREQCDIVDLTSRVEAKVEESGILDGTVTIFVAGATAGLTTVEYEPGLLRDLEDLFDKLAPATRDYHHEKAWHDGNGYSHVRASLLKPDLTVPVIHGELTLGTWQQIVLINFDNRPRTRRIVVQVMGR